MIREKQTVANRLLDIDFFPIHPSGRRIPERAPKTKPSSEEQMIYNYNRATRRLIEVINANFDERDYICVPTFAPDNSPATKEELDKIIGNFIRRINDYKKRRGLKRSLYVYVRECETYKTGKKKGKPNPHCHIIVQGRGISRDKIKKLWHDGHINVDEYDPDTLAKTKCSRQGRQKMIDAKKYLEQIAKDDAVIENKLAEIRRLESFATNISSVMSDTPVQSSGSNDSVGKIIADIVDKKTELQLIIDKLNADRDERIKVIEQLEDRLQYSVIYKRYVDLMRFEDIADEIHYSYRWITKIHNKGLKNIQNIINCSY